MLTTGRAIDMLSKCTMPSDSKRDGQTITSEAAITSRASCQKPR